MAALHYDGFLVKEERSLGFIPQKDIGNRFALFIRQDVLRHLFVSRCDQRAALELTLKFSSVLHLLPERLPIAAACYTKLRCVNIRSARLSFI